MIIQSQKTREISWIANPEFWNLAIPKELPQLLP